MYTAFETELNRRAKLVAITRRSFAAWDKATLLHASRVTSLTPSPSCIAESRARVLYTADRYEKFQTILATEAGIEDYQVYNAISGLHQKHISTAPALFKNL